MGSRAGSWSGIIPGPWLRAPRLHISAPSFLRPSFLHIGSEKQTRNWVTMTSPYPKIHDAY